MDNFLVKNKCALIEYRGDNFLGSLMIKEYKRELINDGHEILWLDKYSTLDPNSILNFLKQKDVNNIIVFLSPHDPLINSLDLDLFRKNKIKSFFYFGDSTEYFTKHDLSISLRSDGVFVTSFTDASRFTDFGVNSKVILSSFNKFNYDLYPFKNFDKNEFKPVSFVGDINKSDRLQIIRELQLKGIVIDIYENIEHKKMCEVFSESFISLNFTKTNYKKNSLFHPLYQLKGRPTEIALSNGFCLSEFEPTNQSTGNNLSMNNIFTVNDFYNNIIYYFKNPEVRNQLAKEANKYCKENLNVKSAVDEMILSLDLMNFGEIPIPDKNFFILNKNLTKISAKRDFFDFLRLLRFRFRKTYFKYPIEFFKGILLGLFSEVSFYSKYKNSFVIDARGANYKPCGVKSFVIDQIRKSKKIDSHKFLLIAHDDNELILALRNSNIEKLIISRRYSRFNLLGSLFELFLVTYLKPKHWLSLHSFLPLSVNLFSINSSMVLHDTFALDDEEWWGKNFTSKIKRFVYYFVAVQSIRKTKRIYIDNKFIIDESNQISQNLKNKIKIIPHGLPNLATLKHFKIKNSYKYEFIFIGNTRNYKNIKLLFKTWDKYVLNDPKSKLCIISNAQQIKRLVNSKNIDIFVSPKDKKMHDLLSESRFVIITSLKEGVGLVAYESILQNKFLIIPDIPLFISKFSRCKQVSFFKSNSINSLNDTMANLTKRNSLEIDLKFQENLKDNLNKTQSIIDLCLDEYG